MADNVDDYISEQPKAVQPLLKELRGAIQEAAPEATEKISYQMPAYHLGENLIYFGAFKKHIGVFPTSRGVAAFKKELGDYTTTPGTIQLPLDEPLPLELIKKIVRFRVKEATKKLERKAKAKAKAKPGAKK